MTRSIAKEDIMKLAVSELEELFTIVGDLGFIGYKISMCKLKGFSYQQCANRFEITKSAAQRYYEKCIEKGYDIALKKIFGLE